MPFFIPCLNRSLPRAPPPTKHGPNRSSPPFLGKLKGKGRNLSINARLEVHPRGAKKGVTCTPGWFFIKGGCFFWTQHRCNVQFLRVRNKSPSPRCWELQRHCRMRNQQISPVSLALARFKQTDSGPLQGVNTTYKHPNITGCVTSR